MENEAAEGVAPAPLAIESLDDYVRRFGLPRADADNEAGGDRFERLEASERVRAEEAHFHHVIAKHIQKPAADEGNGARLDDASEGAVISVLLADNSSHTTPVSPLVAFCDTVKRMVLSRKRFGVAEGACANNEMKVSEEKENEEVAENSLMELSLVEFDATAALQFIGVLTSLKVPSKKRRLDGDATNKHVRDLIDEGKIAEENIVECIRVAHYLQCVVILEALTSILEVSIDSHNCMAICSLADALNLTSLFEASVNYVIERLDAFQGNVLADKSEGGEVELAERQSSTVSSSEEDEGSQEEIWASLPHELRSRVLTMRNVMRSSVVGRGSKVSGIFFSSGQEFLAIFRESIRDQKERLADARERSEQVIRDRMEEWSIRCQRRGRWFDASPEAKKSFVYASDVTYGLEKIKKQSIRLATLESFYEEQKVIFKCSGVGSEIRL
ncbi:hypothetical protein ACHAXT_008378 [Thalassiosira profunda]